MQFSPHQLKDKLLGALDSDYNVVDMPGVLEVVSALETYPVTKETLEETRLGRYVNEMRRKSSNKELAKRAKNLVRKWKQLVESSGSVTVNGEGIAGGALPPHLPSHLLHGNGSGSKPASPASRPGTPSSIKSTVSPSLPPSRSGRPDTPQSSGSTTIPVRPATPNHQSRLSPKTAPLDPLLARLKPSSPSMGGSKSNSSPGLNTPGPPLVSSTPIPAKINASGTPVTTETMSKGNAANKKRRRNDITQEDGPSAKKMLISYDNGDSRDSFDSGKSNGRRGTVNGVIPNSYCLPALLPGNSRCDNQGAKISPETPTNRCATRGNSSKTPGLSTRRNASMIVKTEQIGLLGTPLSSKTPKVKTTAQLVQELRASGGLKGSSETVSKIASNQIEKEVDPSTLSIVPPEAKPRPRRKPGTITIPPSSQTLLEQTKKQRVEDFLQTSVTPSSSDLDLAKLDPPSRTESPANLSKAGPSNSDMVTHRSLQEPVMFFIGDDDVKDTSDGNVNQAEELERAKRSAIAQDPWSYLPPLMDINELDCSLWDLPDSTPDQSLSTTDQDVDRLHNEHWSGVNGQSNYNGQWADLTETFSAPSYDNSLLHILPYVNIDD